jgi:hypothetical protein
MSKEQEFAGRMAVVTKRHEEYLSFFTLRELN